MTQSSLTAEEAAEWLAVRGSYTRCPDDLDAVTRTGLRQCADLITRQAEEIERLRDTKPSDS